MLLSVFTPVANTQFLEETYRSLHTQQLAAGDTWEWVLVPNSGVAIPDNIRNDSRVHVFPYQPGSGEDPKQLKIGALKRFACDCCQGDVFIELDHDDILLPGILADVAKAIKEGAGFVYSDDAHFRIKGEQVSSETYSPIFGWESYDVAVYGQEVTALKAFPLNPRSLCQIFFAPDHVRAWSRTAYYKAGGHDPDLLAGDDHDLMCRTYIAGAKFTHTGTVGYLYRRHDKQNFLRYNAEIQQQTKATELKYLYPLIDEWCRRESLRYVDLGPILKANPRNAWTAAMNFLGPVKQNTVGCVKAFNCLHLIPQQDVQELCSRIYEVLTPSGWFCSLTASTAGVGGFSPDARSYWNEHTFRYLTEQFYWDEWGKPPLKFQSLRVAHEYLGDNFKRATIQHIRADLSALKGQHQPGGVGFAKRSL